MGNRWLWLHTLCLAVLVTVTISLLWWTVPAVRAAPSAEWQAGFDLCALFPPGATLSEDEANGYLHPSGLASSCEGSFLEAGIQSLIITVHPSPEEALADARNREESGCPTDGDQNRYVTCGPVDIGDYGYEEKALTASETRDEHYILEWTVGCFQVHAEAGYFWMADQDQVILDTSREIEARIRGGSLCPWTAAPPAAPIDLSIDYVEVSQAIQDDDDSVPLVAGKSTVVRVFIRVEGSPGPVSGITIDACGMGTTFRGMTDTCVPAGMKDTPFTAPLAPDHANTDDSLNLYLPPEMTESATDPTQGVTYPLELWINPNKDIAETNYDNNRASVQLTFAPTNRLRVGYLRVGYMPPGSAFIGMPSEATDTYDELVRKLYPIADDGLDYYEIPVRRPYTKPFDPDEFIVALRKAYDMFSGDKPDQLVAWLPEGVDATVLGYSDPLWCDEGGCEGRVAFQQDTGATDPLDPAFSLAHEMAHNFGLRHTSKDSTGDPLTDGCNALDPNTLWPYDDTTIQEYGFDVADREVIDSSRYDLMTYCAPPVSQIWISPYSYTQLYNSDLRPRTEAPSLRRIWHDSPWSLPLTFPGLVLPVAAAEPEEQLVVSGWASRDGSTGGLDPAYHSAGFEPGAPYAAAGGYCLQLSGESGAPASHCFDLLFVNRTSGEVLDREPFTLKVPFPAGTTRVALLRGDVELAVLGASPGAPALAIDSPAAGDTWDGSHTVSWTATDTDGDGFTYTVLYSPDGGETWYTLELDTTEPQLAIETAQIAGGDNVLFRVLATDGLNTTEAEAGPIEVRNGIEAATAPPAVGGPAATPSEGAPREPGGGSSDREGSAVTGAVLLLCGGGACLGVALLLVGVILLLRSRARRRREQQATGAPGTATGVPPAETEVANVAVGQAPARSATARLIVVGGDAAPPCLDLMMGSVTIGRQPGCAMVFADPTVSRQHARLEFDGRSWTIVDLNSLGGTYVNGARVARQPLRPGDQIQIGQTVLSFRQGVPGPGGR